MEYFAVQVAELERMIGSMIRENKFLKKVLERLEGKGRESLKNKMLGVRLLRKSFYIIKDLTDSIFYQISKLGIKIGIKIVVTAEK